MLAVGTSLACQDVAMDIQNHRIGINYQLSLRGEVSESRIGPTKRTLKV